MRKIILLITIFICIFQVEAFADTEFIRGNAPKIEETRIDMICTPKVRHFWRCIFLWQRKGKNIENTRQNSNYLL